MPRAGFVTVVDVAGSTAVASNSDRASEPSSPIVISIVYTTIRGRRSHHGRVNTYMEAEAGGGGEEAAGAGAGAGATAVAAAAAVDSTVRPKRT